MKKRISIPVSKDSTESTIDEVNSMKHLATSNDLKPSKNVENADIQQDCQAWSTTGTWHWTKKLAQVARYYILRKPLLLGPPLWQPNKPNVAVGCTYWGSVSFTAILETNSTSYLTLSSYPYLLMAQRSGDLLVRSIWIELAPSANESTDMLTSMYRP